ncbi:MAG: hypothetical protein ABI382_03295 [Nakamurella sp.]
MLQATVSAADRVDRIVSHAIDRGDTMGKRARKKKARKNNAANHGKRPNS